MRQQIDSNYKADAKIKRALGSNEFNKTIENNLGMFKKFMMERIREVQGTYADKAMQKFARQELHWGSENQMSKKAICDEFVNDMNVKILNDYWEQIN